MTPNLTLHLPWELLEEIINLLPLSDKRSLSLTCRLTRKLTLHSIFGHLKYAERLTNKIRNIHRARNDVKEAIKKLELVSHYTRCYGDDHVIFQFLQTLPNLQSFKLVEPDRRTHLSQLIASLRHAPLNELTLHTKAAVNSPTIGLSGLERLSVMCNQYDQDVGQLERAHAQLYGLIRPSLTTLVDLKIDEHLSRFDIDFDLQLLKPAGSNTLRSFEYFLASRNASVLDTIPVVFPQLISLNLRWRLVDGHSILWKDAHIDAIAKNQNLIDLTLSSDFEIEAEDPIIRSHNDYPWFVRSYERRFKATQKVVIACKKLERCTWNQVPCYDRSLKHVFVVEERMSNGHKSRVVRGLKQNWMGRNHWVSRTFVKCRLENLPGEVIGENDALSDSDYTDTD